jgi:DNA-binding response OmpR family regulator
MTHMSVAGAVDQKTDSVLGAERFAAMARPIRVLMVEDNEEQAEITRLLISNTRPEFDLRWERSLMDAMEWLKTEHPDVILLDLGLPELDGVSSHTAIRVIAPQIPVVILTADESKASRERTLFAGAKYYLVKDHTDTSEICDCLLRAAKEGSTSTA